MSIRDDLLTETIRRFFDRYIFGAERRALLAGLFPASDTERAARDQATAGALNQRLRQIEATENAHAREI